MPWTDFLKAEKETRAIIFVEVYLRIIIYCTLTERIDKTSMSSYCYVGKTLQKINLMKK